MRNGKRWPIWVQVDSNASSPEGTALMISPAKNFDPKGRYIVALRNLVDADGHVTRSTKRLPLLPGRRDLDSGTGQPASQPLRGHLQDAEEVEDQALRPLPGLGLHGRQQREQLPPRPPHARRSLQGARRQHHGRRDGPGNCAGVRGQPGERRGRPADQATGTRHLHRAVLPVTGLRARQHDGPRLEPSAAAKR